MRAISGDATSAKSSPTDVPKFNSLGHMRASSSPCSSKSGHCEYRFPGLGQSGSSAKSLVGKRARQAKQDTNRNGQNKQDGHTTRSSRKAIMRIWENHEWHSRSPDGGSRYPTEQTDTHRTRVARIRSMDERLTGSSRSSNGFSAERPIIAHHFTASPDRMQRQESRIHNNICSGAACWRVPVRRASRRSFAVRRSKSSSAQLKALACNPTCEGETAVSTAIGNPRRLKPADRVRLKIPGAGSTHRFAAAGRVGRWLRGCW